MNLQKTIIFAGALLILSFSGACSVIQGLTGGSKVKKEAVLPRDRENIHQQTQQKTFNHESLAKGILSGDWVIETVNGKEAKGETAPYIRFSPSESRIYGNNGCNTINASYKYNPQDSTISFDKMISTMMACGMSDITDYEINAALNNTRSYSWKLDNSNYYLYFYDAHHTELMSLMHQNFDFLNGTWRVVSIEDEPVNIEDMKLVIDVDEGKLHGNTGCNILNGSFETDMETPNSISFQSIATTRMACPDPQYETMLLVALEDASHAKPVSSDKVLLLDSNNKVVLTLVRTTDQ